MFGRHFRVGLSRETLQSRNDVHPNRWPGGVNLSAANNVGARSGWLPFASMGSSNPIGLFSLAIVLEALVLARSSYQSAQVQLLQILGRSSLNRGVRTMYCMRNSLGQALLGLAAVSGLVVAPLAAQVDLSAVFLACPR